ncbi:hypothetical protein OpiT1DRAFT_05277 [Opitutaceae bacterium TAV1]|nr:hypothetical protein OpiT1DRAFT_05277 [Opitutaceae bacterium TAV1]
MNTLTEHFGAGQVAPHKDRHSSLTAMAVGQLPPTTPLALAHDELEKSVACLRKAIEALARKLEPVCLPMPDKHAAEGATKMHAGNTPAPPSPPASLVVRSVRCRIREINLARASIDDLIGSLDV